MGRAIIVAAENAYTFSSFLAQNIIFYLVVGSKDGVGPLFSVICAISSCAVPRDWSARTSREGYSGISFNANWVHAKNETITSKACTDIVIVPHLRCTLLCVHVPAVRMYVVKEKDAPGIIGNGNFDKVNFRVPKRSEW